MLDSASRRSATRARGGPRALLLLVAAAPAACGDGGPGWQGAVRDSAGVEIVSNTGSGAWAPGEAWAVEEDLRIGSAEGEPELQFGTIIGMDVGSDGRIYVMDQQAREVRVFSQAGEFITRIGKPGSGPGELSQAAGPVFVGAGDTVAVPDLMQQRVNRYTPDGEPAGSFPLPMTEGFAQKWVEDPQGRLVQQAVTYQMPGQENVEPSNRLLVRGPEGQVMDTLMELPMGRSFSFAGGQPRITVFESEPMWTLGPDGRIIFGNNSEYRFQVHSPDGELQRVVTRRFERKPVSQADQQEFRRIIEEAWKRAGLPPQATQSMAEALQFADYYPAYANLFSGPDGSMWVQSVQTPESVMEQGGTFDIQDVGGPAWDVFDAEGRFLGEVTMPGRFMPLLFHQDHIYGVLRDDMDVQYAARMRVLRGNGQPGE